MAEIKDPQWAQTYFDRGIDTHNRRIFLTDIEEDSAMDVIKALYYLDTINDDPIELFICSYGGSVAHCLAIFDIIKTLSCPVHTFAFGVCQSAAPLLLAAGAKDQRWVAEHTQLMTHQYSETLSGRGSSLAVDLKQGQNLDDKWNELLASLSSKTPKFWKDKSSKVADFYFSADDAIAWGIADSIWKEK